MLWEKCLSFKKSKNDLEKKEFEFALGISSFNFENEIEDQIDNSPSSYKFDGKFYGIYSTEEEKISGFYVDKNNHVVSNFSLNQKLKGTNGDLFPLTEKL